MALPRSFHALSYKNQQVTLDRQHRFKVGPLSEAWRLLPKKGPGLIFKHRFTGATLATEASCGGAFEDISLPMLTDHLMAGLKASKKIKEERWRLSSREALYSQWRTSLDGAPVALNIVVIKKTRCTFDFLAISMPQYAASMADDFENFVKGFDY